MQEPEEKIEATPKETNTETVENEGQSLPPKGSGMRLTVEEYLEEKEEENGDLPDKEQGRNGEKEIPEDESGEEQKEELNVPLEELDKESLIAELKKSHKLITEREQRIKDYETKLSDANSDEESEVLKDIEALKADFKKNYVKLQKKFNLPPIEDVIQQYASGDITSRLKQYQENVLKKEIEEKFKLAEDEFEYDPKEAAIAGTPSYEWALRTTQKQNELLDEANVLKRQEQERIAKLEEQQLKDKQWIAEKFYDNDINKVEEVFQQMNEVANKVARGEEPPDKHPLALRNLLLGFFHDDLVKKEVSKAVSNLQKEYAKHGLYLPKNESPTDISDVKSVGEKAEQKKKKGFSPMQQTINQYL